MKNKTYKLITLIIFFGAIFLVGVKKTQASSLPEDLTQPFEYGLYTINMPLILAEDSVLWELLSNFDTLTDDDCIAKTEPFIATHRTAVEALFPWFDSGDTISEGTSTFCDILSFVPSVMARGFASEGFVGPVEGGLTTNIFDPTVTPNWHAIDGLVFDHPLVRIQFTERIDLLSYDFVAMVLGFPKAFDVNTGYVALNSEMIQGLKSTGAVITLKNVPNFDEPVILVDGVIDEELISAFVYDKKAKTITFNTAHFTSFKAVELSSVPVEDITEDVVEDTVVGEEIVEDEKKDNNKKKRPKIYSAKIERLTYADGRDYYKVTAKGKNFDKDFNMYIGGRKSVKEVRVNKRRAIGYFDVADFENALQETYKFKVYNSSKRKRTYDHELPIKNVPHQYMD